MALNVSRNDPAGRERAAMADTSTRAEERLYETVDGKLVREGDPRGAFLKYGQGDPIAKRHENAYKELRGEPTGSAKAYSDEDTRAELRLQQAVPDTVRQVDGPVLMHDKLATELADEARAMASLPDKERAQVMADATPDKDAVFTPYAVWRTDDGRLVREGDTDGVTQAYAAGDRVQTADLDAYNEMDKSTQDSDSSTQDSGDQDGTKAAETPANKARTVSRSTNTK